MTTRKQQSQKERKMLTVKFCDSCEAGEHLDYGGPVPGLILVVGPNGSTKSWLLRFRYKGRRREMGLGPYPDFSLAEARDRGSDARRLLARNIDPIEQRKQQERRSKREGKSFLELATEWIDEFDKAAAINKDEGLRERTRKAWRRIINVYWKPLHDWKPRDINHTVVFDKVLEPMMARTPSMMDHTRYIGFRLFKRFKTWEVFPLDRWNPCDKDEDGPLAELLNGFKHRPTHLPALHFNKIPTLIAALVAMRQRRYIMPKEAARAVGCHPDTIYADIYNGRLKADKSLLAFPTSRQHWQIKPADLYALRPPPPQECKIDLLPPQAVASYILEFSILTGTRPSETRMMRKSEYDPATGLWTIPWQRHKEGRKTRQDHIVPLAPEAIEIIDALYEYQRLDKIETEYVFSHLALANTLAKPGHPPSAQCVRNLFKYLLGEEFGEADLDKVQHALRTAFRSWGETQRRDGLRLYDDKMLERAINHIKGYGDTSTVRIYNRDTPFIAEEIPFNHWARYCYSRPEPVKIISFRHRAKSAIGG
jgi:integrase